MLRRFSTVLLFSLLCLALIGSTAFAAKSPVKKKELGFDAKTLFYSFPDEHNASVSPYSGAAVYGGQVAVGTNQSPKNPNSASPGVKIGDTWYDYQHNCSMGRMVDWGPHQGYSADPASPPIVHFAWMNLPDAEFVDRKFYYAAYKAADGSSKPAGGVQGLNEYAGYVNVDISTDNRVIISGHVMNTFDSIYQAQIYWDLTPAFGYYNNFSRVPDETANEFSTFVSGDLNYPQQVIWPKFRYQAGPLNVTHVVAEVWNNIGNLAALYYFRKVGDYHEGTWDFPPVVIDSIGNLSHAISCDRTGSKVGIAFAANLPYIGDDFDEGGPSGESPIHYQMDNDIHVWISPDQGATWTTKRNITEYKLGEDGFRAYCDLSALMTSDGNFHVLWSGPVFPANPDEGWSSWRGRMFHWSENVDYLRTVVSGDYEQEFCGPGPWQMNVSKMQLSECNGRLYALYQMFNHPSMGYTDDCHARYDGGTGDTYGSANGELWLSISEDDGLSWDAPRNLTNSYTKDCNPANGGAGGGPDCDSDMWPTMAPYGRLNGVYSGGPELWPPDANVVVDPSGGSSVEPDYYLDVLYVNDRSAGGIVQDEGSWQISDMNWFRVKCVEAIAVPQFTPSFKEIQDPTWTKPSVPLDKDLLIENTGNYELNFTWAIEEDLPLTGTTGWLDFSGALPGNNVLASGVNNKLYTTVHLNAGGIEDEQARLTGRLIFDHDGPSDKDTIEIDFIVADTLVFTSWDTVFSSCLALRVASNGNYGRQGSGPGMGWHFGEYDCDTLANAYLYDGSPVVGWIDGVSGDTVMNYAIFDANFLHDQGLRPQGGQCKFDKGNYSVYNSGVFTTHDSTVAMSKLTIAPNDFDCSTGDFMIQALKVWSHDGQAHNGLIIGDAIDWDVPSDSGSLNTGHVSDVTALKLIFQSGAEYHADDSGHFPNPACQTSDTRHAGLSFISSYRNGALLDTNVYSGYTAANDTFVYPTNNFVSGELYRNMVESGLRDTSNTPNLDLHMVMTYAPSLDVAGTNDTVVFYTVLATVMDGPESDLEATVQAAHDWFEANSIATTDLSCEGNQGVQTCCEGFRGDVDGTSPIDIDDVVYLVDYAFGFPSGPPPPCEDDPGVYPEADVDNSGFIDIDDVVYLVDYAFGFPAGPQPHDCPQ